MEIMVKMTHDYNFECNCWRCFGITKFFHLKNKKEAQNLGYDTN